MSVVLKLVNGTQKTVDVPDLGITVLAFKKITAPVVDISADEQRIVLRGKVLKDEDILSAVGMEHGNAVHIVRSRRKEAIPDSTTNASQGTTSVNQQAETASQASVPQGTASNSNSHAPANPYAALFESYMQDQLFGGTGGDAPANPNASNWPLGMGSPLNMQNETIMQILQNPAFIQLSQTILQNPELAQRLSQLSPSLGNMSPEMLQANMQFLNNPELMRQIMSLGTNNVTNATSTTVGATNNTNSNAPAQSIPLMSLFPGMIPPMQPQGDPHVVYRDQLQQLREMGFPNEDANIAALQQSQGNISFAIERLFNAGS